LYKGDYSELTRTQRPPFERWWSKAISLASWLDRPKPIATATSRLCSARRSSCSRVWRRSLRSPAQRRRCSAAELVDSPLGAGVDDLHGAAGERVLTLERQPSVGPHGR